MIKKMCLILIMICMSFMSLNACNSTNENLANKISTTINSTNKNSIKESNCKITYEIQSEKTKELDNAEKDKINEVLTARYSDMGFETKNLSWTSSKTISLEANGKMNIENVANILGSKNDFKFVSPDNEDIITLKDIKDAAVDPELKQPVITLRFTEEGSIKFSAETIKYEGKKIKIYLDDELLFAPTIFEPIVGGTITINSSKTLDEAKALAYIVKSGKTLPYKLKLVKVEPIKK